MNRLRDDRAAAHPPLEGEGRPPERSGGGRGGVTLRVTLRVHPTPLASLATLPLQGRVGTECAARLGFFAGRQLRETRSQDGGNKETCTTPPLPLSPSTRSRSK